MMETSVRHPHRVLVLCTGNSARSQMAEGLLRELGGEAVVAASAGVAPTAVHPMATQAMAERGVDIGDQRSKSVDELAGSDFDTVITVCDHAAQTCPAWVGKSARVHWSIPDPAAVEGRKRDRLEAFRQTRDLLEEHLAAWLEERGLLPTTG